MVTLEEILNYVSVAVLLGIGAKLIRMDQRLKDNDGHIKRKIDEAHEQIQQAADAEVERIRQFSAALLADLQAISTHVRHEARLTGGRRDGDAG